MTPLVATLVLLVCAAGLGALVLQWGVTSPLADSCDSVRLEIDSSDSGTVVTPFIHDSPCVKHQVRLP